MTELLEALAHAVNALIELQKVIGTGWTVVISALVVVVVGGGLWGWYRQADKYWLRVVAGKDDMIQKLNDQNRELRIQSIVTGGVFTKEEACRLVYGDDRIGPVEKVAMAKKPRRGGETMIALLPLVVGVFVLALSTWRRRARIRYLIRAEALRLEMSSLRHQLVMYAGSGEMPKSDRKAFDFLYSGATFALKYPEMYRIFSDHVCLALMDPDGGGPPKLKRSDLSPQAKVYLAEYVNIASTIVDQFAHPIFVFFAFVRGKTVMNWATEVRAAVKTARTQRAQMQAWRDSGRAALGENMLRAA